MTEPEAPQVTFAPPMPLLTPEEVTELARDIVTNRIFITNDYETMRMCFLVFALAPAEQIPENLGACYEYIDKASERGINGMPMFFSAHFVPGESLPVVWDEMQTMREALGLPRLPEAPPGDDEQNETREQ